MVMSVSVLVLVTSLHLLAFLLAIGAESRRSTAKVVPDEYVEETYCVYTSDVSTVYGLSAFGLLLLSQTVVNAVTRCPCFGKGLVSGCSSSSAIFLFFFSWITFMGAQASLLAGSARNAYHTKYRRPFGANDLSCSVLQKGVFAAGPALTLSSTVASIFYYWSHSRADTGGWEKHQNEGLSMPDSNHERHQHHQTR